ncbi:MAG TPA: PA domain-containing protein [Thermoanaerobaculia bacterium]|nr:PA domain-containing protein [Thermoanaerobaculia bacterium]
MRRAVVVIALLFAANAFAGTGRILIVNADRGGEGLNDPTPAAPVGGNPGTTLGAQRLNVFLAAAERWQSSLDLKVDILISARFAPITRDCNATSGILGFAGAVEWRHDFPGAPRSDVWYPIALANQFALTDLSPSNPDISMQFNSAIGTSTCLSSLSWYYGLDRKHGTSSDLFVVALHEIAHGLGISGTTSDTGDFFQGLPSVFDTHTLDVLAGLRWDQMSPEQRRVSMTNSGSLVWGGSNVRDAMARHLEPMVVLGVNSRDYEVGAASFGPAANRRFVAGRMVLAADAANDEGPSTTDACTAFTNASDVAGRIVLADRGTCTFVTKARNAQAAGALALVVANNVETCQPLAMGGTADDITIPAIGVKKSDGDEMKAQLAAAEVNASLRADPARLAGTNAPGGYLRLFAPCTFDPGSSTHHWDDTATPNLLMEPFVNGDLLHGLDLTLYQMLDIGWSLPPRSGRRIGKR